MSIRGRIARMQGQESSRAPSAPTSQPHSQSQSRHHTDNQTGPIEGDESDHSSSARSGGDDDDDDDEQGSEESVDYLEDEQHSEAEEDGIIGDVDGDDSYPECPPKLKDISGLASWTVSSSKPGCTVKELRAATTSLYWQSDGDKLHTVNIHFPKMVNVFAIQVYIDYERDESYTPLMIEWFAGTSHNDLDVWEKQEVEKTKGWVRVAIPIQSEIVASRQGVARNNGLGVVSSYPFENDADFESDDDESNSMIRPKQASTKIYPSLRCMLIRVCVVKNQDAGKDTHLRGLRVFARKTRDQEVGSKSATTTQASVPNGIASVPDTLNYSFHTARAIDESIGDLNALNGDLDSIPALR